MTRTTLTAALALSTAMGLATAAAAATRDVPITATYQPATQRFCVRAETTQEAAAMNTGIHQRRCMTARMWRSRGVTFTAPIPEPRLARM